MTEQLKIDLGPVYLRPITLEDTENIVKWRNTDRVRKNFIYQKPFTKEGHLAWMRDKVAAGEVVQFILCETEGDRPVGSVYFRDIDTSPIKRRSTVFLSGKRMRQGRVTEPLRPGPRFNMPAAA